MYILALDVGTTHTGWVYVDVHPYSTFFAIRQFGKTENELLRDLLVKNCIITEADCVAYEEFASYGMPIGVTTMQSILWNGRFIEIAASYGKTAYPVFRREVKMHLCNSVKAKDANVRQALIDKFGEPGTKKNPGRLYGISADMWSALAIAVTFVEKKLPDILIKSTQGS